MWNKQENNVIEMNNSFEFHWVMHTLSSYNSWISVLSRFSFSTNKKIETEKKQKQKYTKWTTIVDKKATPSTQTAQDMKFYLQNNTNTPFLIREFVFNSSILLDKHFMLNYAESNRHISIFADIGPMQINSKLIWTFLERLLLDYCSPNENISFKM